MRFPSFPYRVRWEVEISTEAELDVLLNKSIQPNLFYRGMPNRSFIALTSFYRYYLKKYSPPYSEQGISHNGHLKVTFPVIDEAKFISESFEVIDEFVHQLRRRGITLELPLQTIIGLAQHYGLPTNLMDFTSDPLIGLYFATEPDEWNENEDCVLYESDIDTPNRITAHMAAEGKLGFFKNLNGYDEIYAHFMNSYRSIEREDRTSKVPYIDEIDIKFNHRIRNQKGVFIYNPNSVPYDVVMYNVYDDPYVCEGRTVYVIKAHLKDYVRKALTEKAKTKAYIYPNDETDLNKSIIERAVRFTKLKLDIP
ncbi:FRG domain-containing protein [Vibrio splendidus]